MIAYPLPTLSAVLASCILLVVIFPTLSSASQKGSWSKTILKTPDVSVSIQASLKRGNRSDTAPSAPTSNSASPALEISDCHYDETSLTDVEKILKEITDMCSMRTTGTPQNRAYHFLLQDDDDGASSSISSSRTSSKWHQRFALATMYFSFTADPFDVLSNWEPGTDECQWNGITCDESTGLVTDMILIGEGLEGTIASEIQELSALVSLNLNDNELQGTIPTEFGRLGALTYLSLNNNQLHGTVPTELGHLGSLKYLDLHFNELLEGQVPSELGNLRSLVHLDLSENAMSGSIPTELGGCVALRELHLSSNKLSGDIPSELGALNSLNTLWVYGSDMTLSARVPLEVCQGASLTWLHTEVCLTKESCCSVPSYKRMGQQYQ